MAIDTMTRPTDPQAPQPAWDVALLFPPQGQWSRAEYLWLDANRESKRLMEFSNGFIEVLDMPSQVHQVIIAFLYRALFQFAMARNLGTVLFAGLRVKLSDELVREPDVVFMRKENNHRRHNDYWEGADLVMEVLSSNREHDLVTKRKEYAAAGIPEYWIVDPQLRTITVLTLRQGHYFEHGVFAEDAAAQSVLLPGFEVSVAEMFNQ
jgi:Uma2 family endonuclease